MQIIMLRLKIDIKQKFKFATFFILSTLLVACSTLDTNTIDAHKKFDRAKLDSQLLDLVKWQVSGVIGIIYNNKADSANYTYSQDKDNFIMSLYGPLGVGKVEISGDKNKVILKNSKGEILEAKDVKTLMLDELGWYVPLDGLKYWIKAIAVPQTPANLKLKANNLAGELSQQGWKISYQGYELIDQKYPLPTKFKMSRGDILLKVVIKSWRL
ncbi:outer membrane lipoprotein LolB [Allofrancisella frigidaquae]|uniref:Outer-membrane lipoprotein LolB n=2 Tax=Allofrancisella frigidaquae TaxID=1085644 RepID=A0A6M3HRP8_9GAMM|nr:outer membrane lipoprotein LolB [Allofrancisella frigidaquae]